MATLFYGVKLPPFESDDYVELELDVDLENQIESEVGCRVIEIGESPFCEYAIAITESIQETTDEDTFLPAKFDIDKTWDLSLGLVLVTLNCNVELIHQRGWYLIS